MDKEKIARINALAAKQRGEGLTDEERIEQKALRDEYVAAVKNSLVAQLDNTYVVDEKGVKKPLKTKNGLTH